MFITNIPHDFVVLWRKKIFQTSYESEHIKTRKSNTPNDLSTSRRIRWGLFVPFTTGFCIQIVKFIPPKTQIIDCQWKWVEPRRISFEQGYDRQMLLKRQVTFFCWISRLAYVTFCRLKWLHWQSLRRGKMASKVFSPWYVIYVNLAMFKDCRLIQSVLWRWKDFQKVLNLFRPRENHFFLLFFWLHITLVWNTTYDC